MNGCASSKKKILFIINSLQPGGAEKVLLDTVRFLKDAYHVTVCVCYEFIDDHSSYVEKMRDMVEVRTLIRYKKKGSWIQRFPYRLNSRLTLFKWDLMTAEQVYNSAIGNEKFDIMIAFLEGLSTRILSGAPSDKKNVYAWVHTDMNKNPWSLEDYKSESDERNAYQRFDRVFAVSNDVAQSIKTKYGIDAEFVQNVVDDASIKEKADEDCPYPVGDEMELVAVGTHSKVKGYDRLIRALRVMKDEGYQFRMHFVGSGNQTDALMALRDELGLDDVVFFEGRHSNPYPFIKNADLTICSSYAEGFSGVTVESLILGTPVLTTNCAGMKDIFGNDDTCGMIVENSEEGLVGGLRACFSDCSRVELMAEGAKKRGEDFSTDNLIRKFIQAIDHQEEI